MSVKTEPVSLPLHRYPFARTASFDEACELYSRTVVPVRVEMSDRREAFASQWNRAAVGPLFISTSWYLCGLRSSAADSLDFYSISLARAGSAERAGAGQVWPIIPQRIGVIFSPTTRPSFRTEAGCTCLEVTIPRSILEASWTSLTGLRPRGPLLFQTAIDVISRSVRLIDFLVGELDRSDVARHLSIVTDRLVEAFLYSLLSEQPHSQTQLLDSSAPASERRYVRQIEEYLDSPGQQRREIPTSSPASADTSSPLLPGSAPDHQEARLPCRRLPVFCGGASGSRRLTY